MLVQMMYSLVLNQSQFNDQREVSSIVYGASIVSRYKLSNQTENEDIVVLLKVLEHLYEIDNLIEKYSNSIPKNRLANVVLSILRIAIYELKFVEATHKIGNIIKDYLNIAIAFEHSTEAGFINGILDKIYSS